MLDLSNWDPPVAKLVSVRLRVGAGGPDRIQVDRVPNTYYCVLRCSYTRARALLFQHLPVLTWLPRYPVRDWLLGDLLAGLSVAIMQLPQGEPYLTQRLYPQSLGGDLQPFKALAFKPTLLPFRLQAWPMPSWLDCPPCLAFTALSIPCLSTSCLALPGTSPWVSGARLSLAGGCPRSPVEDRMNAG